MLLRLRVNIHIFHGLCFNPSSLFVLLLQDVKFFDTKADDLLPGQLQAMRIKRLAETALVQQDNESLDDNESGGNDIFFDSQESSEAMTSSYISSSTTTQVGESEHAFA